MSQASEEPVSSQSQTNLEPEKARVELENDRKQPWKNLFEPEYAFNQSISSWNIESVDPLVKAMWYPNLPKPDEDISG